MARYIDADNLVERLKVSPIFQDFGTDGYFIRDMVIDLVGCRPTADVVPKSEVAREIIAFVKQWDGYALYCAEELEKKYLEGNNG